MKDLLVAVSYSEGKTCKEIYKVLNVDEPTFKKLVNEKNAYKLEKEQALNNQARRFYDLDKKVSKHDFLLAKSIYDNFVDRGLLEDNDEFQKLFYDIIFNKAEIDLEKAPQEYLTILEYVRGK